MPGRSKPLAGKRVVITRPRERAGETARRLRARGAVVLAVPAIRIEAPPSWRLLDAAIDSLGAFDWVAFSSSNGVEAFARRLKRRRRRFPRGPKVAAVGPTTAEAVRAAGLPLHRTAHEHRAEGLVHVLGDVRERRVLWVRPVRARETLAHGLRLGGAEVVEAVAYRTEFERAGWRKLAPRLRRGEIFAVTFTSTSTVEALFTMFGASPARKLLAKTRVVSIGPVTSASLRARGVEPAAEARPSTLDGLVRALAGLNR